MFGEYLWQKGSVVAQGHLPDRDQTWAGGFPWWSQNASHYHFADFQGRSRFDVPLWEVCARFFTHGRRSFLRVELPVGWTNPRTSHCWRWRCWYVLVVLRRSIFGQKVRDQNHQRNYWRDQNERRFVCFWASINANGDQFWWLEEVNHVDGNQRLDVVQKPQHDRLHSLLRTRGRGRR